MVLRLPAALLLPQALPGGMVGMEQAPSGQAVGSVQWSEPCWLPVGFLPAMESPKASGALGMERRGEAGRCLLEGKWTAGQASLGMGTLSKSP